MHPYFGGGTTYYGAKNLPDPKWDATCVWGARRGRGSRRNGQQYQWGLGAARLEAQLSYNRARVADQKCSWSNLCYGDRRRGIVGVYWELDNCLGLDKEESSI